MKSLSFPIHPLQRAPFLPLIMAGCCLITFPSLRAQSTNAAAATTPPTNSPAAEPPADTANPGPAPAEVKAPPLQVNSNAAPANATPDSSAIEGSTNAGTPGPLPPAPDLHSATNQPPAEPEGPGEISNPQMSNPLDNPAVQDITNQSGDMSPGGTTPGVPNSPAVQEITKPAGFWDGLLQRGSPLHLGLNVGETYDDNILISPDKTSSFLTHITPSVDYQRGDQTAPHMNYLNIYFAPTFVLYQSHSEDNRTDYNADLYYQYTWTRLAMGIEQQYQHLTDASLDVGTLVSRDIYTTKYNVSYIYDDDLTLYGTGTQSLNYYPDLTINEWDIDTFGLYQVAPKLLLGAGPRFAFVDISGAANQTHQDLLFRLKYLPDSKISLSFDGGAEYLQYQDNTPSRIVPIFDATITYTPTEGRSIFLSGYRATFNSYDLRGDTIGSSTIQIGASQQFLRNFKATATFGYQRSDYNINAGTNDSPNSQPNNPRRNDDYYIAKGVLEWTPNLWLKVQASYQWSQNQSTFAENTFSDNQIDIQSSVNF